MRTGCRHLREGGFERLECLVFGSAEERRELPVMDAVVVDLLVVKPGGADELMMPKLREEFCAQTRIGGQLAIRSQPLGEGPGADVHAEPLLDMDGNALARVATVVAHDSIEE